MVQLSSMHSTTSHASTPLARTVTMAPAPQSNGDEGRYWRVLSDAGITRQRLESFDRPIRTAPHFFADKKARPRRQRSRAFALCALREKHAPSVPCKVWAVPLLGKQLLLLLLLVSPCRRSAHQDALIREFRNYLGILKAVHSGADLTASAAAVGSSLPQGARGYLGYVTSHIGDSQVSAARRGRGRKQPCCAAVCPAVTRSMQAHRFLFPRPPRGSCLPAPLQILPFIEAAVEARTEVAHALSGNKCVSATRAAWHAETPCQPSLCSAFEPWLEPCCQAVSMAIGALSTPAPHPCIMPARDLLYLDLALETGVRSAAERGAGAAGLGAAALMAPLLQNLALSQGDNEEACFCLKAWQVHSRTGWATAGRPAVASIA